MVSHSMYEWRSYLASHIYIIFDKKQMQKKIIDWIYLVSSKRYTYKQYILPESRLGMHIPFYTMQNG